ncbi:MAG: hypothetical protein WDN28_15370 [Chthoniobacter sp.]
MRRLWALSQLPEALRGELVALAAARGFRDAGAMLTTPQAVWQPPVPLAEVAGQALGKARKLCTAFAGTLQRLNDLTLSEAEFRQRGLADYRAVFGYEISAKQWKRLLDRTVTRDHGAEDWQRMEIYLDENCARRAPANTVAAVVSGNEHRELCDLIASFKKPSDPTKDERGHLWQCVFDRYSDLIAGRREGAGRRRSLVAFLAQHAPSLAKTPHALHVALPPSWRNGRQGRGGRPPSPIAARRPIRNAPWN